MRESRRRCSSVGQKNGGKKTTNETKMGKMQTWWRTENSGKLSRIGNGE